MKQNKRYDKTLVALIIMVAICGALLALTGCDSPAPPPNTPIITSPTQSSGLMDNMASAAVGGLAAGAGASVGHAVTTHAIKSYKTRKRARRMRSR